VRRRGLALAAVALVMAVALPGCGYHVASEVRDPLGPFAVTSGHARIPYALAIGAAEEGARSALSRAGELATCSPGSSGCNLLVVELLRADETSEGVALPTLGSAREPSPTAGAAVPLARGLRVTLVGRAFLRRAGSDDEERGTEDLDASEVVATPPDAASAVLARDDAARRAARRLGERLARHILGFPEPSEP
jgi:hypothetical protein